MMKSAESCIKEQGVKFGLHSGLRRVLSSQGNWAMNSGIILIENPSIYYDVRCWVVRILQQVVKVLVMTLTEILIGNNSKQDKLQTVNNWDLVVTTQELLQILILGLDWKCRDQQGQDVRILIGMTRVMGRTRSAWLFTCCSRCWGWWGTPASSWRDI